MKSNRDWDKNRRRDTTDLLGKVKDMPYHSYKMSTPIQIVPRIQSLELDNVGCWESLRLEFTPGLNIITGDPESLGKTTILSSIISEVSPSNDMGLFAPPVAPGKSRIVVQLMPSGGTFLAGSRGTIPPQTGEESHGQYMMRLLKSSLATAEPDGAVIFDDEVFRGLDDARRSEAVKWLNETTAQVIYVAPRWMDLDALPKAKVFVCSWDKERDQAEMSVRQQGQQTGP